MITQNQLFLICAFIVVSTLSCFGQERVVLLNGRVIEGARLFKENALHITYERYMSLHDIEKAKIDFIETSDAFIRFDSTGLRITRWKEGHPTQKPNEPMPKNHQPLFLR